MPDLISMREATEMLGVTSRTLRHWEDAGLLNPVRDGDGSMRKWPPEEIRRARLIMQMQKAGLSLKEIKRLLELMEAIEGGQRIVQPDEAIQFLRELDMGLEARQDAIEDVRGRLRRLAKRLGAPVLNFVSVDGHDGQK